MIILPLVPSSSLDGLLHESHFQSGVRRKLATDTDEGPVLVKVIL